MHLLIFWEEGEGSRNSRTFTPDRRCDHVKIAGGGHVRTCSQGAGR